MSVRDWLQERYPKLDVRFETMLQALALAPSEPYIVETGCVRMEDDWGGGMSTLVFSNFVADHGGKVTSVDLSKENTELCAKVCKDYKEHLEMVVSDSAEYLASMPKEVTIDLLYLDSFDYPYGSLLEVYGGKVDIHKAIEIVGNMTEEEIVDKHFDIINPSQEHCLKELKAALPHLLDETPILIDDGDLPGGGKPRLAKLFLAELGYECLEDSYQTLWIKER